MITIKNVSKTFNKKTQALKDVSIDFSSGHCVALIGPNGCGKTTLIKSILGLVVPDKGEIIVDGENALKGYHYRSKIGYMPQIGRYPENMRISGVLSTIQHIRNNQQAADDELYKAFEIERLADKRMRTLSGGTTQKVSATLAFMFNPDILILDEPTAGLDPLAAEILKEKIVKEKEKGKLILITSHLLSELDDLVSEVIFMQEGSLIFHLPVSDLKSKTGEEKISKAIANVLKKGYSA